MIRGPLCRVRFRWCEVVIWTSEYLETVFPDGGTAEAVFDYGDASRGFAEDLGYGADLRRMHLEHECAHTFLAEAQGLSWSPVLRRVAGGPDISAAARAQEEALVFGFQRYVTKGAWDSTLAVLDNVDLQTWAFRALVKGPYQSLTAAAEYQARADRFKGGE